LAGSLLGPATREAAPVRDHDRDRRAWVAWALSPSVVRIALRTSLVVGTALNVINQSYALFYARDAILWLPFALNYAVPYSVATYSAVSMVRRTADTRANER